MKDRQSSDDERSVAARFHHNRSEGERYQDDCQRLIDRIERLTLARDHSDGNASASCCEGLSRDDRYAEIVAKMLLELRQTTGATAARVRAFENGDWITVAQSAFEISSTQPSDAPEIHVGSSWLVNQDRVEVEARFDDGLSLAKRAATDQLLAVLADLIVPIRLQSRVAFLESQLGHQSVRDRLIADLHRGSTLEDSFAFIASTIAKATSIDRVCLLRRDATRHRLVACSIPTSLDRRSDHARMLRQLADRCLADQPRFGFTIGTAVNDEASVPDEVFSYMDSSGCCDLYLESIVDPTTQQPVATIALERFQIPLDPSEHPRVSETSRLVKPLADGWAPFRGLATTALCQVIQRDSSQWITLIRRSALPRSKTTQIAAAVVIGAVAILSMIPVSLDIPGDGRIVPVKQSRIYSPAEGVVAKVLVTDGEAVTRGQTMMVLRSDELDLTYQSLTSQIETARTRLASLTAMRTGKLDRPTSVDEQTVQAELAGLDRQLASIRRQQEGLTLTSPMDGTVDQWNVAESLASRPVTHGQYLISVVSRSDGWNAELEILDQSIAYVIQSQSKHATECSLKLRSDPTTILTGRIDKISEVADVNAAGQSVVTVRVPIDVMDNVSMRRGATVVARIHCGKRAAGFVYLRSFIHWYRQQSWF